jgi:galactonate dehydratase
MAEAYDVALAPHCPLGPVALAACLHVDFVSAMRSSRSKAWGFTTTRAPNCLILKNKEDFNMEGGFFKPLMKPGWA